MNTLTTANKPSAKQVEYADALGIPNPESMTRSALRRAIDRVLDAQKERTAAARLYPITRLISVEGMNRETPVEYSGPCPRCKGDDRLHVNTEKNTWFCRHCLGGPKWRDPIAYLMTIEGMSFLDALNTLERGNVAPVVIEASTPRARVPGWHSEAWRKQTRLQAIRAAEALDTSPAAMDYLNRRGIDPETARRWRVGAAQYQGAPCITFPYWGPRNGEPLIKALHYAAIDRAAAGWRYKLKADSERTLYGVWLCNPTHNRTLILCEGELNAISISQAAGHGCDVVSFGSDTPTDKTLNLISGLSARYALVIVWADETANAVAVGRAAAVGCAGTHGTRSIHNPGKMDANDLLQRGELPAYMQALRALAWEKASERIAMLYERTRDPRERARLAEGDERLLEVEHHRRAGA